LPKNSAADDRQRLHALLAERFDILLGSFTHEVRQAKYNSWLGKVSVLNCPKYGLRIDNSIKSSGSSTSEGLLIDHSVLNSSSPTFVDRDFKYWSDSTVDVCSLSCIDFSKRVFSDNPCLKSRRNSKTQKYSPIVKFAERLCRNNRLSYKPRFLAPIISTWGVLDSDWSELREFLCSAFKKKMIALGPSVDGLSAKERTSKFRSDFNDELAIVLAVGTANV
jgi:hypothetical protein